MCVTFETTSSFVYSSIFFFIFVLCHQELCFKELKDSDVICRLTKIEFSVKIMQTSYSCMKHRWLFSHVMSAWGYTTKMIVGPFVLCFLKQYLKQYLLIIWWGKIITPKPNSENSKVQSSSKGFTLKACKLILFLVVTTDVTLTQK